MMENIPAAFFGGAPGGGEILLILVVLLLLFGAKKLPGIARSLGKTLEEFRRAARDVTDEIMHADEDSPGESDSPPEAEPEAKEPTDGTQK